jgi:hypothetical protein
LELGIAPRQTYQYQTGTTEFGHKIGRQSGEIDMMILEEQYTFEDIAKKLNVDVDRVKINIRQSNC